MDTLLSIPHALNASSGHQRDDYAQIGYLALFAMLGCPLNLAMLIRMLKMYAHEVAIGNFELRTAYLLLKVHLIIANLVLLLAVCPVRISWLMAGRWTHGIGVCRGVHAVWVFALALCAYLTAVIGVDRAITQRRLATRAPDSTKSLMRHAKILLIIAYALAIVVALPQLFVWRVLAIRTDWQQCVTQWTAECYHRNCDQHVIDTAQMFTIAQLVVVFFIPLAIIVVSCAYIGCSMVLFSVHPDEETIATITHDEAGELNPTKKPTPIIDAPSTTSAKFIRKQSYQTQNSFTNARRLSQALFNTSTSITISSTGAPATTTAAMITSRRLSSTSRLRKWSITSRTSPTLRLLLDSNTYRSTALLLALFILLWTPYYLFMLIGSVNHIGHRMDEHQSSGDQLLVALVLAYTIVNPFVFGFCQ